MGAIFVISVDGERLMPTFNQPKVRKMLKDGRAVIYKYQPFTIQLTYKTTNHTQDIEYCSDYGSTKEYRLNQKNTNMSHFRLICLTTKKVVMMTEENIVVPAGTEKDTVHQDLTTVSKTKRLGGSLHHSKTVWTIRFDCMNGLSLPNHKSNSGGSFDTQVMEAIEKGEPPKVKIIKMVRDMDSIL